MRIAFFMQGSVDNIAAPRVSDVMEQLFCALRNAGAELDFLVAESQAWDLSSVEPAHDLYVMKSKTPMSLSLAAILSARGGRVINTVESCRLARDKIATEVALAACNLPVPPAWATGQSRLLQPLLDDGPLWLKARAGSKGRGVSRVTDAADAALKHDAADSYGLPQPLFAQRDVPSAGRDTKVYVIGDRQWAITRPWPAWTADDKQGQPTTIDADLRATAAACGKALGLEIYGVDFLIAGRERHVVDVNAFPGFKGIEQAPREIANYLLARAKAAMTRSG